jgi:hypothetical protein
MKIAILGGTGHLGRGLAARLSETHEVCIGSRTPDKARLVAARLHRVKGSSNEEAARWCESAIVSVPYGAAGELKGMAPHLVGKVVISTVNPLKREDGLLQYGSEGASAAALIATMLPDSLVATAFNNIPPSFFRNPIGRELDVLIAADTRKTYDVAASVVLSVPNLRPLYVGPLSQAESVERLTVLVMNAAILNGGAEFSVKLVS